MREIERRVTKLERSHRHGIRLATLSDAQLAAIITGKRDADPDQLTDRALAAIANLASGEQTDE